MIPRPSALAVLVASKKGPRHPRGKESAVPRIDSRKCLPEETKGKNKTDLPTNPKWQIGLLLCLKPYRGGSGLPQGERSVPLRGVSRGDIPSGRFFGDFLIGGESHPGSEGRSALPMGGAQRRALPSSLLCVQLAELLKSSKRLQRRLRRQLYKKTGPQSPVFSRILGAASRSPGSGRRGRRRRSRWCPPRPARSQNRPKQRCSRSA